MKRWKVGLTRDLLDSKGKPSFGAGPLELLDAEPDIEWEWLPELVSEITPELAARYDALYVSTLPVPHTAVAGKDLRVRVIARHGVGFDSVDVAAMTAAGVLVTNTPAATRRPVATMALTFVLALAQKLFTKDRLTRAGRWNERNDHMGMGLTGRTLGLVGAGRIGREILRIIAPLEMRCLAADPNVKAEEILALGARLTPLDTLLAQSDFVIVCCVLDASTRYLIDAKALASMKPSAYLINVARGPIVDERTLIEALAEGRIAGAALDVFEQEPIAPDNPLLRMDNVIVTPHALCWTDECFDNIARDGLQSIVDVLAGRVPKYVVDRAALESPRVREWALR
jgi:phosphoglycerate dehydrogenase-like enzyme